MTTNSVGKELFVLAPYCEVRYFDGKVIVGFGSIGESFDELSETDVVKEVLLYFRKATHPPSSWLIEDSDTLHGRIFQSFLEKNIIVKADHVPDYSKHHREQLYYLLNGENPNDVQKALSSSKVCIVGCGGIGSFIAVKLAVLGVGSITLIDDDIVEAHNISRQFFFSEKDMGKKKVDVLSREILNRAPSISIKTFDERIDFQSKRAKISLSDLVVLSADQPGIIDQANEYYIHADQPFLHACYINDIAAWGPLVVPKKTGCWSCKENIGTSDHSVDETWSALMRDINGSYTCPIVSPVSSIALSFAVLDILRFLGNFQTPHSFNTRIGVWTHDLHFERQDFQRVEGCPVCGAP